MKETEPQAYMQAGICCYVCGFCIEWPQYLKMYPPDIPLHFSFSYGMQWALRLNWLLVHLDESFPPPSYCTCDDDSFLLLPPHCSH